MDNRYIINLRNPLYSKYLNNVQLYYNAYQNENIITEKTLPRFPREIDKDYELRKNNAIRINYFKFFVDLYFKALFSGNNRVEREGAQVDLSFNSNIDLKKHNVNDVITSAGKHALIGKQSYLWIDSMINPSYYDRPFVKVLRFQDVIDWETDRCGNYEWVLIKQIIERPLNEWVNSTINRTYEQFTFISRDEYRIMTDSGRTLYQHDNPIKEVPVVKVCLTDENFDGIGDGIGKDIFPLDIEIMNILSLDKSEYSFNNFHILSLPISAKPKNNTETPTIGINNVYYSSDPSDKPAYISPTKGTYEIREKRILFLIDEMMRITGFKGKDSTLSKVAQSGVSKLFDYINTNETLISLGQKLKNIEYSMFYYIYKLSGGIEYNNSNFDSFMQNNNISYPTSYNVVNIDKEVENLYNSLNYGIGEKYEIKAKKQIARINVGDYCKAYELEEIERDIEQSHEIEVNDESEYFDREQSVIDKNLNINIEENNEKI